ncbi:MAG: hypothetical protein LBF51_10900 [Zoogloeaceae bacterium]|nr:hypothetical protein [Zoogloeaceae bacterium]
MTRDDRADSRETRRGAGQFLRRCFRRRIKSALLSLILAAALEDLASVHLPALSQIAH